jgi:hypothetical protein
MTAESARAAELPQAKVRTRLHRYRLPDLSFREIVLLEGAAGSRLVVDRFKDGGGDARLLAHLSRDEPDQNAVHVYREYLADPHRCCRTLRVADLFGAAEGAMSTRTVESAQLPQELIDRAGARYLLAACGLPAELRWHRERPGQTGSTVVSARDVVAALEDYEPVLAQTRAAVAAWRHDRKVAIATLGLELRRLEASPIVLNRRLREAVVVAVRQRGVSLSAIAIACGRMKRDPRGNGSGETSWLARRVGLIPDGAGGAPNPWVHTDTLALIARDGLGIAPREVELG